MKLDRGHVKSVFKKYTDTYDSADPKIYLKIIHTYHVAEDADEIARSLDLSEEDCDIAWLLGMLHDLGRFEQIRRYHTFNDSISVPHAHLSCEVLFPEHYQVDREFFGEMQNGAYGQISDFVKECSEEETDLIRTAIWEHSSFRLPDGLAQRHKLFCNLIRDADKVDIFRVNVETEPRDLFGEDLEKVKDAEVSDQVIEAIQEHTCVKRRDDVSMTSVDHLISHICLAFELVYPKSFEIAEKQGYLRQLTQFESRNPKTQQAMIMLRDELNKCHMLK